MATEWTEIETIEKGKFKIVYDFLFEPDENPNDAFGIWEPAKKHEGGVTVKMPNADPHRDHVWWKSCNTTPGELAKEYAKDPDRIRRALAGEKLACPSREAYDSLQKELQHYVLGEMYTARARVFVGDEEVSSDMIAFDYSTYSYKESVADVAKEMCEEHFPVDVLLKTMRKAARARAMALRTEAKELRAKAAALNAAAKEK